MESQTHSQIFGRFEPVIAAFAAAGRREWRAGGVDPKLLVDLLAVQAQLDTIDPAARASPDAEANAVEAAIEAAIRSLPDPFRTAALDQFAFTDDKLAPRPKGEREKLAAKSFSRGDRWYRKASQRYYGLSPKEYVVRLVTCALCGVRDPIAFVATREQDLDGEIAADGDPPKMAPRGLIARHRWVAVFGGVIVVFAVFLTVVLDGQQQGDTSTIAVGPPVKRIKRAHYMGEEEAKIALDACTGVSGCRSGLASSPLVIRARELVSFKLHIYESFSEPIATLKLVASATAHENFTEIAITAEWTIPLPLGALESRTSTVRVTINSSTPSVLPRLEYIAGTTQLYKLITGNASEEESTLKLPDGLFSPSGITLRRFGPQRHCRGCVPIEAGSIHFDMRPVAIGL